MPNKARGESEFLAGDQSYVMKLTLGALAEIENALSVKSLSDIGTKLKNLGSGDIAAIASALLRGGGFSLSPGDVLKLATDLGSLIGAITDAFDAVGLGHHAASTSVKDSSGPLAGTTSSPSP
ncbi:MAG: gene transfer agent family protein [Alphaproteobacteria bacterium]|nr:gene transfer agent family protein [Alphaproteobacteria bacterium]